MSQASSSTLKKEVDAVTKAIEISLGVREIEPDFKTTSLALTKAAYAFTAPPVDDEEQSTMLTAQRAVAKLRTGLVKDGDELKKPLNAARARIIAIVDREVDILEKAEAHTQGLINHRQQKLADDRRAADAAAERERIKAEQEAAAATKAAQEAEAARLAAEKANDPVEKARLQAEAEQAEATAFEAELAAEAAASTPVAPVSDLPMAKEYFDFTLAGRSETEKLGSLMKLLCAHPELAKLTAHEATPRSFSIGLRIADLMDRINSRSPAPPITTAPGIIITSHLSKLR